MLTGGKIALLVDNGREPQLQLVTNVKAVGIPGEEEGHWFSHKAFDSSARPGRSAKTGHQGPHPEEARWGLLGGGSGALT